MKIDLILGAKPIKKRSYELAYKYKPIVQKEIEGMLTASIFYPINKSKWASPMVWQPKKHDPTRLRTCVDFHKINKITV